MQIIVKQDFFFLTNKSNNNFCLAKQKKITRENKNVNIKKQKKKCFICFHVCMCCIEKSQGEQRKREREKILLICICICMSVCTYVCMYLCKILSMRVFNNIAVVFIGQTKNVSNK